MLLLFFFLILADFLEYNFGNFSFFVLSIYLQNDKKSVSRLHVETPDLKAANTFSAVSYSPL